MFYFLSSPNPRDQRLAEMAYKKRPACSRVRWIASFGKAYARLIRYDRATRITIQSGFQAGIGDWGFRLAMNTNTNLTTTRLITNTAMLNKIGPSTSIHRKFESISGGNSERASAQSGAHTAN